MIFSQVFFCLLVAVVQGMLPVGRRVLPKLSPSLRSRMLHAPADEIRIAGKSLGGEMINLSVRPTLPVSLIKRQICESLNYDLGLDYNAIAVNIVLVDSEFKPCLRIPYEDGRDFPIGMLQRVISRARPELTCNPNLVFAELTYPVVHSPEYFSEIEKKNRDSFPPNEESLPEHSLESSPNRFFDLMKQIAERTKN